MITANIYKSNAFIIISVVSDTAGDQMAIDTDDPEPNFFTPNFLKNHGVARLALCRTPNASLGCKGGWKTVRADGDIRTWGITGPGNAYVNSKFVVTSTQANSEWQCITPKNRDVMWWKDSHVMNSGTTFTTKSDPNTNYLYLPVGTITDQATGTQYVGPKIITLAANTTTTYSIDVDNTIVCQMTQEATSFDPNLNLSNCVNASENPIT